MKLLLKNVRLAFNDLYEPTQINGQGKAKYRATLLVEKNSQTHKDIEAAIKKVATEKWGAKAESVLASIRNNNMRFNVQDGDLSEYDGFAGNVAVKASSETKPTVIDRARNPVSQSSGIIYSGCYVNASISFFAYDNQGKGISASLGGIQFLKDGEAFAGGRPADINEFEDLSSEDLGDDPAFA